MKERENKYRDEEQFLCFYGGFFFCLNEKKKKSKKRGRRKRKKERRVVKFRSTIILDAELSIKHSQCSRIFARATLFCESDVTGSWAAVSAAICTRFSSLSWSGVQ